MAKTEGQDPQKDLNLIFRCQTQVLLDIQFKNSPVNTWFRWEFSPYSDRCCYTMEEIQI